MGNTSLTNKSLILIHIVVAHAEHGGGQVLIAIHHISQKIQLVDLTRKIQAHTQFNIGQVGTDNLPPFRWL